MPPFASPFTPSIGQPVPMSPSHPDDENSSCLPVRRTSNGSGSISLATPPFSLPKLHLPSLTKSTSPTAMQEAAHENGAASGALAAAAAAEAGSSAEPDAPPAHTLDELLVLVHGLQGTAEDFTFFEEQLQQSPPALAGQLLIHVPDVNTEKTHDGIVEGGMRLAADVRRVVAENPSLSRISLVGFSLGGMYVRYAAGVLYDSVTSTVAGLTPQSLVTVASPNLGVRRFGVYRFIPQPLFGATKFLFGQTGDDLVLNDEREEHIVVSMSKDSNPLGMPFLSALKAFQNRVLYGNMRQDFMVNWGTSVLDASVQKMSGHDVQGAILDRAAAANAERVDHDHDAKGCKIVFQYSIPKGQVESTSAPTISSDGDNHIEESMAHRLQSVGWQVVAIDLPMPLPFAHNRIMAMSRGPFHSWLNAPGRRAVMHLVDTLVGSFENHERLFEPVQLGSSAPSAPVSTSSSETATATSSGVVEG